MTLVRTPLSRVFTIEDRAGPANAPVYQDLARALSPTQGFGDVTPVRIPDPDQYGQFKIVDTIRGEKGLPEITVQARYEFTVSSFLALARKGCPLDVQVHMGKCQNPTDFNSGWDKILVVAGAAITQWSTGDLGALDQGEDAVVNEDIPVSGLDMYEIKQLLMGEFASAEVIGEVVGVAICDSVQCGICGVPSNGCEKVFAITITQTGSPGLPGELVFSEDGGTTISETTVDTLGVTEDPSGLACVGLNLVIVSNDSDSLHYAPIADILDGTEIWIEVATGIVAAGSPNAIFSLSSLFTWIVGDGGYVYFTADPTAGVTVQDAGIATTEVLNDVHAIDDQNIVAVGANNAVIVTTNGGDSWASVTGPNVGVALNAIWMRTSLEWLVGDAGGQLWYTRDGGVSWTEKTFPGSGTGVIRDIVFSTPTVGYMAHSTAAPAGRILRTIDGGYSWYVLPEGTTTIPANDYVASLAACAEDPNLVFGGGLADDATDGFLVKGS